MDLLMLAPEIQEKMLCLPSIDGGRGSIRLRELRAVAGTPFWEDQRRRWIEARALKERAYQMR